jgi:hypothetical protein
LSHSGAQERHAPWFSFQHLSQAYWRQVIQKLNVRWNSSVTREDSSLVTSMRAAAMASSIEVPSVMTKFLRPFARRRAPASDGPRAGVGPKV